MSRDEVALILADATKQLREELGSGRFRCTFERVGRDHDVPPLEVDANTPDDLAELVYQAVRGRLGSRDVEVAVDLEAGRGLIFCGFQVGGRFTIERLDPDAAKLAGPHALGCPALGPDPDGIDQCECADGAR